MKQLLNMLVLLAMVQGWAQVYNTGLPIVITEETDVVVEDLVSDQEIIHEGRLHLYGDLVVDGLKGNGEVLLTGGTEKTISLGGRDTIASLTIQHGDVVLTSTLLIQDSLIFHSGILHSDSQVVFLDHAGHRGSSDSSYVDASVAKVGAGDFQFPIGSESGYRPVTATSVAGTNPIYSMRALGRVETRHPGYGTVGFLSEDTWELRDENGAFSSAQIRLPYEDVPVNDVTDIVVAAAAQGSTSYRSQGGITEGNPASGIVLSEQPVGPGSIALAKYFNEQLRVNDSLALLQIFVQTEGENWVDSENWFSGNLDSWSGIHLVDKRVRGIELRGQGLTGTFPGNSEGLEALRVLDLADNELREIESLNASQMDSLDISANRLQFGTLQELDGIAESFVVADQKSILEAKPQLAEIGETSTLNRQVTGSGNTYQWFRNGESFDETGEEFMLDVLEFEQEGDYYAVITNPQFPDLALTTQPIRFRVSSLRRDSLSLLDVYQVAEGENWTVGNDWPERPIREWAGLRIIENRVVGLDLAANNLSGQLSSEINFMGQLVAIDLSNNSLTRVPDLSSLSLLDSLDVSGNALHFDDLEANLHVAHLNYADQAPIGISGYLEAPVGTAHHLAFEVGGSDNRYQWVLNGQEIEEADANSLIVEELSYENMGDYVLKVTSERVPGLTLSSHPQTLLATADIRFIPTYQNRDDLKRQLEKGEAYLFKLAEPGNPFDSAGSVSFGSNGIAFDEIVLDDYVVFTRPDTLLLKDEGTYVDSVRLLPTYYSETLDWVEADTLRLRSDLEDSIAMLQQPRPLTRNDGDGIIRLSVFTDLDEVAESRIEARRRVKKAGCSLRRRTRGGGGRNEEDEWALIAYKETDDNGEVSFGFLPEGEYRLNIQYPGVPMDPESFVEFEITSEEEMDGYDLTATITEEAIFVEVVEELGFFREFFEDLTIYPNPATDYLNLSFGKLNTEELEIQLLNLQGRVEKHDVLYKGYQESIEMDVRDLNPGVYLLQFTNNQKRTNTHVKAFKVVIQR